MRSLLLPLSLSLLPLLPPLLASPSRPHPRTHGVPSHLLPLYTPTVRAGDGHEVWRCLDGSREIGWEEVNDEYCDCADGSDEPGTSACPNGTFHCMNVGHLPGQIPSWRVDDGLCEPECCDGTDEPPGVCPDRCAELGEAWRRAMEQDRKVRRTGSKIRSSYIAYARKEKRRLEEAVARGRQAVEERTREERRLKAVLDRAENMSAESLAHKQKSPLFTSLQSHSSALTALLARVAQLESQLSTLKSVLAELEEGHNPNYQDMAVRGAIKGYREFLAAEAGEEGEGEWEGEEGERREQVNRWTEEELRRLGETDLTALLLEHEQHVSGAGSAEAESILFSIEHYLPEAWAPYYESTRSTLLTWLVRLGVIPGVLPSTDSAEVTRARTAHADAVKALREAESGVRTDEEALGKIGGWYGPEGEWLKLKDVCIEKNTGEYTYSVCFFGQATQKPNSGGASNNLGRFSRWNRDAREGTIDYYSVQVYDNGAKCWNGPNRSVKLVLTCGTENELLSVAEPEKCEYQFEGTSPALCWPLEEGEGKPTKEEL